MDPEEAAQRIHGHDYLTWHIRASDEPVKQPLPPEEAMIDAYETLGLSRLASDAEIRSRYLDLVREFPPDRAPERFASVRAAYEQLRDPARRLHALIFNIADEDSIPAIIGDVRKRLRDARLTTTTLLSSAAS